MSADQRPEHDLRIDYLGGTAGGAPIVARCTARGCDWPPRDLIRKIQYWGMPYPIPEPLALTSYHHWMHQLDVLASAAAGLS